MSSLTVITIKSLPMYILHQSRFSVPQTWSRSFVRFSSEQVYLIWGMKLFFLKRDISYTKEVWYNIAHLDHFIHVNFTNFHRMWHVVHALTEVRSIHLHKKLSTEANIRLMRKSSLSACHSITSCIRFMCPALGLEEVHENLRMVAWFLLELSNTKPHMSNFERWI